MEANKAKARDYQVKLDQLAIIEQVRHPSLLPFCSQPNFRLG